MQAFENMIDTREKAHAERLPKNGCAARQRHRGSNISGMRDDLDGRLEHDRSRRRRRGTRLAGRARSVGAHSEARSRARRSAERRRERGASRSPAPREGRAVFPPERIVQGAPVARAPDHQGSRPRPARSADPLDPCGEGAQERADQHRRVRRAHRRASAAHRCDPAAAASTSRKKQNDFLAQIAVRELQAQKDRLATYQIQARFALATMYDRAANADQLDHEGREAKAETRVGRRSAGRW